MLEDSLRAQSRFPVAGSVHSTPMSAGRGLFLHLTASLSYRAGCMNGRNRLQYSTLVSHRSPREVGVAGSKARLSMT